MPAGLPSSKPSAKRTFPHFFEAAHDNEVTGPYEPTPEKAGMRSLRNLCLAYAHAAGNPRAAIMLKDQYQTANNLTDKLAALQTMVNSQTPAKSDMEVDALKRWYNEPLLINKWLSFRLPLPRSRANRSSWSA